LASLAFFRTAPAPTAIYTLSLHDALPICAVGLDAKAGHDHGAEKAREVLDWCLELGVTHVTLWGFSTDNRGRPPDEVAHLHALRSEEHTSELQSRENLVCRLLLEKKKKTK